MTRISLTLAARGGQICCAACGHALGAKGTSWKRNAALSTVAVKDTPGAGLGVDQRVIIRKFACPGCSRLLDTEIALPEDPFLDDFVSV